jgi:hypothetical protein
MNEVSMDAQDLGFALTPEQQGLLEQLPKAPACSDALHLLEVDITGALDPQRLQAALDALLAQQPMLVPRLAKAPGFHGLRQFAGGTERFPLTVQTRLETAAEIHAQVAEWAARSFVVGESENAQAMLYRQADNHWTLVLGVARHCVDESGLRLIYQQLLRAYEQGLAEADDETGEFTQYLEWRSEVVLDEDAASARTYWQQHLQGAEVDLSTPWLGYRAATAETSSATALLTTTLEPTLHNALQQLAGSLAQPLSVVMQAAWWLLLGRLGGNEQMLVGVRHDSRDDYEYFANAVGVFERTLPLHVSLAASTSFSAWVSELAARLDEHRTWQEYWSPELAPEAARPSYGFAVWHAPLPQTSGTLQWTPVQHPIAWDAQFELMLQLESGESGNLHLHYAVQRYSVQAVEGLMTQFGVLLASIVANPQAEPGQLALLGAAEQQRLLAINPQPRPLVDG